MKKCREMGKIPCTMAIDTWGVDYALLDKEGKLIGDVYAYRDGRNAPRMKDVHAIIPENELYARTGIQPITFNTVYQLYDDKMTGKLEKAELAEIVEILLSGLRKRLLAIGVDLVVRNAAVDYVLAQAGEEGYGARPLKRVIQRKIEDRLSEEILKGNILKGETVTIDAFDGKLTFKSGKLN